MKVVVRDHAIERSMDENRFNTTKYNSREQAYRAISRAIKYSILLKLNPDGSELRGHNGKVYACRKGLYEGIIVYTVLRGTKYVV